MMNAFEFLGVDRSLDSNEEMAGRFQLKGAGSVRVIEAPEVSGRSAGCQPTVVESGRSRVAGRSMWRKFFGWIGARQVSPGADSSAASEAQPELAPAHDREGFDGAEAMSSEPVAGARSRFRLLPGRNPFGRPAKEPAQAEFRFENVRVVCNELHDTDFIIKT